MSEEGPFVGLDRLESLVERLEQDLAAIAAHRERLARALEARKERDRAAVFEAWRRGV